MFSVHDILSITTGVLVSKRHMDGVYDILNYMTGDDLFTHALPRASDMCRPALLEQHPQLATVDADAINRETYRDMQAQWEAEFGTELPVEPLADWKSKDPLTELRDRLPDKQIVVVAVDDGPGVA